MSRTVSTVSSFRHRGVAYLCGDCTSRAGVVLHLAIRHPEVVRKLVLASVTYTLSGVHPGLMEGLGEMKPEMMFGSPWHEEYMAHYWRF